MHTFQTLPKNENKSQSMQSMVPSSVNLFLNTQYYIKLTANVLGPVMQNKY